jgi:hypothetical protein
MSDTKKHWPDCVVNYGGAECDMGPNCGSGSPALHRRARGAQNVAYPMSGAPKMHFRRWAGVSALACDPALTPDAIASDAVTYAPEESLSHRDPDRICPWCDYSRRVYLEPGLSNPPSETWAFEVVDGDGSKVWLPFEINGTSSFRPPKGARVLRATDPEVQATPAPPPLNRIVIKHESDPQEPLVVQVGIVRRLGEFALTAYEAESLRAQLNAWHARQPEVLSQRLPTEAPKHAGAAVAARIFCPTCRKIHVDRGVWATKPHSTHLCEHCGALWRTPTVGIEAGTPKLYEIDDGGATHWVAAHSPERAKQVWVDAIGEAPEEWATDPPEVTEVDREKMARLKFTFEDGTKTAMANVFDLYDDEGVVATTEH